MTVARARCQASNRELQRARDRAQQLADEANERHQRRMDQQRKLLEIAKSVQAKGKQHSQWIDAASRQTNVAQADAVATQPKALPLPSLFR